ncbi:MAG: YeeE/YedE family protein, partial [Burkholderiales bacterium]|nr:YeeE/YedE family protein [Burkholderiales bacterium]
MIGLASALLVFTNGRSAGISGIIAGVFNVKTSDFSWRLAFLLGLLVAPVSYSLFFALPESVIESSMAGLVVAGFLVG